MTAFASRHPEYDSFLYATVVEGEVPVSVVSMLSRLNLDPWVEAARLSQLPRHEAIESLSSNIVKFGRPIISLDEADALAAQLVERLNNKLADPAMQRESLDFTSMWLILAIFFGMMTASQKSPPANKGTLPQPIAMHQVETPVLRPHGVAKHDPHSIPAIQIQQ